MCHFQLTIKGNFQCENEMRRRISSVCHLVTLSFAAKSGNGLETDQLDEERRDTNAYDRFPEEI